MIWTTSTVAMIDFHEFCVVKTSVSKYMKYVYLKKKFKCVRQNAPKPSSKIMRLRFVERLQKNSGMRSDRLKAPNEEFQTNTKAF